MNLGHKKLNGCSTYTYFYTHHVFMWLLKHDKICNIKYYLELQSLHIPAVCFGDKFLALQDKLSFVKKQCAKVVRFQGNSFLKSPHSDNRFQQVTRTQQEFFYFPFWPVRFVDDQQCGHITKLFKKNHVFN